AAFGEERIREQEVLAPYTTFKIGGPADYYFEAATADELEHALRIAREHQTPHFLLGMGANILMGDLGFRGLVIRNRASRSSILPGNRLFAESGAVIYPDLIEQAVGAGLSGIEHYVG